MNGFLMDQDMDDKQAVQGLHKLIEIRTETSHE